MKVRLFQIIWPAFLAAGILEMLLFAVVDPGDMHWFGGVRIQWTAQAIYTFTFLLFWGVTATAGAITALLQVETDAGHG